MIDTYDQDGIKIDIISCPRPTGYWEFPGELNFDVFGNPPNRWQQFWFRILLGMKWHSE
jgi:hypothetical protein